MLLEISSSDVKKGDCLQDNSTNRKWRVIKRHKEQKKGWILKSGPTTRIMFPIDIADYSLLLDNE